MGAEWAAAISALLGAGIGVSATLIGDRLRHRREMRTEWHQTRRELYGEFLSKLSHAHGEIRAAAYAPAPHAEAHTAVQEAFRESGIYPIRQQVALLAPKEVAQCADEMFQRILALRDVLRTGVSVRSEEYDEKLKQYRAALLSLRNAMRIDLGVEPLPDDPLDDGSYAAF